MLAAGTVLLLCMTTVIGCVYFFVKVFYRKRRPGEPLIVKGNPIFGSSVDFGSHAVNFLHKCRDQYGDIFTIRLINQYLTIVMDPHAYEAVHKEKNFDFDAIQRQVNWNVFSFVLKEPRKIIKDTARTVKGNHLLKNMEQFTESLNRTFQSVKKEDLSSSDGNDFNLGLRSFTSATIFDPLFTTIFGTDKKKTMFNWQDVYRNFEVFHKYFNYLWLGFPIKLFPEACKALGELLEQPSASELLQRDDSSDYIKTAIDFMLQRGQTEDDIRGHNLVYLHVNYNTFRLAFWVLNNILMDKACYEALTEEIRDTVELHTDDSDTARFDISDIESLPILDSVIQESMRLASGVFMVRYVKQDTMFKTSDGKESLIRAGDRIAIYPPAIHKDPEIFDDPLTFKYERFVDAKFYKNGQEVKHPVIAFGSICPGKRYALLQLRWYIMSMFSKFDLRFADGVTPAEYDSKYHGHEILPPIADVECIVTPRENAPEMVFVRQ